jgi:diphthamide synthase (EF-2-diphthine--ammonia ligase)
MRQACDRAVAEHVDAIAFGDLFLEDIRAYRETQLRRTGLQPLFPLWELPTHSLARDMIAAGLRAKLTCVDTSQLAPSFVGREFDTKLLEDLPGKVDPCGERGEFHTCVYTGPMFARAIDLEPGEIVQRDQFAYADFVTPAGVT